MSGSETRKPSVIWCMSGYYLFKAAAATYSLIWVADELDKLRSWAASNNLGSASDFPVIGPSGRVFLWLLILLSVAGAVLLFRMRKRAVPIIGIIFALDCFDGISKLRSVGIGAIPGSVWLQLGVGGLLFFASLRMSRQGVLS